MHITKAIRVHGYVECASCMRNMFRFYLGGKSSVWLFVVFYLSSFRWLSDTVALDAVYEWMHGNKQVHQCPSQPHHYQITFWAMGIEIEIDVETNQITFDRQPFKPNQFFEFLFLSFFVFVCSFSGFGWLSLCCRMSNAECLKSKFN